MSKKTNKTTAVVAAPKLNKHNAEGFADFLFSEKRGVISCVKLCQDSLQEGKDGNRHMHCAIGEAYATFVNPSLRSVLRKDSLIEEYVSEYLSSQAEGSTGAAIDALVDVANIKDKTPQGKQQLAKALFTCVQANDSRPPKKAVEWSGTYSSPVPPPPVDPSAEAMAQTVRYLERARKVADAWRTNVVPLLK